MMLPWLGKDPVKVAVLGDLILDEYLDGEIARISPEAPVPVHLVKRTVHIAGGAANSASNIACAGGKALLFSVCGDDPEKDILFKILSENDVDCTGVLCEKNRSTIKKTRITAQRQQVVRLDWEKVQPLTQYEHEELFQRLDKREFSSLLISDYGKGALDKELLSELFILAKKRNIPTIVDPKGKDYSKYKDATVITPNRKEALVALGLEGDDPIDSEALAKKLQATYGLNNVLLTMGAQGMMLVPSPMSSEKTLVKKAQAREIFDVSGAGDTVASILALALAANASWEEALELANTSAAIVVGKWGTQPIKKDELIAAMSGSFYTSYYAPPTSYKEKLYEPRPLSQLLEKLQDAGKTVVFTNGCFDILHAGHIDYLEKAKKIGDFLVVGVNTDDSIQRLKGAKRPIIPLQERMSMLAALASVDFVTAFSEDTPLELIAALRPQVLIKAADYVVENIVGGKEVLSWGGKVLTVPLVEGMSTTNIVDKIITLYTLGR